jgi:hypothetical protein
MEDAMSRHEPLRAALRHVNDAEEIIAALPADTEYRKKLLGSMERERTLIQAMLYNAEMRPEILATMRQEAAEGWGTP